MTPRQRAFYQGLFGLGAGILANNAPTRFPGGGTQALGKGLQQGLQAYNQALTMEEKMDALREERALKGELEERIPDLIAQARLMGVDEGILRSAELMASVKPSSVVATLNNAMVKAQKDPRPELTSEQLIYTDPTSKRQFRIKSDGYLGEEIKALPEEKIESSPFSMSRSEVMRSPSLSIYSNQMGPNDILQIEPGKLPSILRAREAQTTPGQVQPLSDEEKQKFQGMDIASKIVDPETGLTTFYNSLGKQITEIPEEKSSPFTLTKSEVLRSRDYADFGQVMGENDILQVSPSGETQIIEAKKAEEVKESAQFNYYTKSSLPDQFQSFSENMGEGDVLKVKDGEASVVRKPVSKDDPEKYEFRTKIIKGEDGKLYEQTGYFTPKGIMVSDFGKVPVKDDKALSEKDKITLVSKTLTKPNQRIDNMVIQFDSIATAVGAGASVDDRALIFYIGKMLDPTSVVREGEQLTIRNTGSLGDQMVAWINRVNSGAPFSKKQRNSIINFAERKIRKELEHYGKAVKTARRQADKLNISKDIQEGTLGIVHENYDVTPVVKLVKERNALLPDIVGGNNKSQSPIKEDSPQASAMQSAIDNVIPTIDELASRIEIPKFEFNLPADAKRSDNIKDDQELESIFD